MMERVLPWLKRTKKCNGDEEEYYKNAYIDRKS